MNKVIKGLWYTMLPKACVAYVLLQHGLLHPAHFQWNRKHKKYVLKTNRNLESIENITKYRKHKKNIKNKSKS